MTETPGDTGVQPPSRGSLPRRRPLFKPILAGIAISSPLVLLVLLDAAVLVHAVVDPASTCWLEAQVEAGRRLVFPFEIHLLLFTATIELWAPVLLLVAALFWYLEWIRVPELLGVAVLSAVVLYFVGFEYQWMVDLYRGRFETGCV